ncbi:54S ribosomal protein L44, mitochondrial AltName: Full=YmL44 [Cyberlindnera jadinii]|uniref:Large ribosomal subunit protein mL53 n=1 Tax=Cyberlindnera jadinii (strain ATCC 18201 / CBS 1600 / BCRC 20928 / JCM 3617 / NBRC 0987 / NRRL Y-1542) TaxID=983966 RepID=A0A0H5C703_CYBJN|nr:hypothetical protein CYBJADRAFT_153866 [Cyberlindnera jadinii NRRL Y-1542]ODV71858.1 hypothetical protein CYBJADRAFT_153866 [Cyberlindnera jadinii NRRL Y-1542]CEP23843.1 54S ribosomal protein L44, mitochondrial AltName: Full=YmL44 [Cyberlindnera jadinii]
MITKYFTKVVIRFNPLGKEGKASRLFLSSIPPSLRGACVIDHKVITDNKTKPMLSVTFKDKQTLDADPSTMTFGEISAIMDRHSRALQIKDSIQA